MERQATIKVRKWKLYISDIVCVHILVVLNFVVVKDKGNSKRRLTSYVMAMYEFLRRLLLIELDSNGNCFTISLVQSFNMQCLLCSLSFLANGLRWDLRICQSA
jgi:hypothetical protein